MGCLWALLRSAHGATTRPVADEIARDSETPLTAAVGDEPAPSLDAPGAVEAPVSEADTTGPRWSWKLGALSALGVILVGVIAIDGVVISRALLARSADGASATLAAQGNGAPHDSVTAVSADGSAGSDSDDPESGQTINSPDDGDDNAPDEPTPAPTPRPDEPRPSRPKKGPPGQTVDQAFARGCSTGSIEGLSRQIIAEARCLDANAFAPVPPRKNLVTPGYVVLHLEAPARDQLLHALDAHPERTMKVNSGLRTVAQQYMLDRWARTGRCGIKLAAHPGESNHETGLALDVSEPDLWRPALEKQGFHWLGPSDRVHFDYQGPGAKHHEGLDVLAFQRLWNRNHPDDRIAENGAYGESTEARIKKSPSAGFATGPVCGGGHPSSRRK